MLDEALNPALEAEKVEAQDDAQGQPQGQPQGDPDGGAPTAPQEPQHVPLAALEAERKGRQDWKEKAIRFEEELKHLREQGQQQPREPAPQLDPLQSMQQQIINERFNTSEMLLRNQHADTDDKVNVFMEAARANPALVAAMQQQRHPWKFAYDEGARMLLQKEFGSDPAAYRAKVEAEIRASMQPAAPAHAPIPASLNGARSVAQRSAAGWTGPPPFESLFN